MYMHIANPVETHPPVFPFEHYTSFLKVTLFNKSPVEIFDKHLN